MKKYSILFSAVLLCTLFAVFVSCKNESSREAIPALKVNEQLALSSNEELDNIQQKYEEAKQALLLDSTDMKQYLTLATVFILEGRITGDGAYYSNAALKMINKVIVHKDNLNKDLLFQAYSLKSTVLLNMHQFQDAKLVAEKALFINEYNSGIYGALVDADVELGQYDSAVFYCDKMLSIRPDLRSYSRASYLRQIHGDNRGAIDAMKMAVESGLTGAEQTEWARVTLGDLYFNIGLLDTAEMLYKMSLNYRPNYPYATMGLARIARVKKEYPIAIKLTEQAIRIMSEPAFIASLADLYDLEGDKNKASEIRNDLEREMKAGQDPEALVKHNANREMAQVYMSMNQLDKAEAYAEDDLKMRPENIEANEMMAWLLFLKKDYGRAQGYADKTLWKNTQNSNSIFKVAAIYAALGDTRKAEELKQRALAINPYIDPMLQMQSALL